VTLQVQGDRALIAGRVEGVAARFAEDVPVDGTGAATRAADRAAVQVAEWLSAVWPAPSAATTPPPAATVSVPGAREDRRGDRAAAAVAVTAPSPPPPARRARPRLSLETGLTLLRAPGLGVQYGPTIAAALARDPARGELVPEARALLSLPWLGWAQDYSTGDRMTVRQASAALEGNLVRRLDDRWSARAGAAAGVTLLSYVHTTKTLDPPISQVGGHVWATTLGLNAAIVGHIDRRLSVVLDGRATWMVPRPVFVAPAILIGDGPWPVLGLTLALRITL
jgi:hypothetical protein